MATATRTSALSVVPPQPSSALERLVDDYLAACRVRKLSPRTIAFAYGYPLHHVFLRGAPAKASPNRRSSSGARSIVSLPSCSRRAERRDRCPSKRC